MANKKDKFIYIVEELFRKTDMPTFVGNDEDLNDVMTYFNAFKGGFEKEKPAFTENGKIVLQYMKNNMDVYNNLFKAKDVGEGLNITSRTASGAMRKLVADKYLERIEGNPIVYSLTDKGVKVEF